MHFSGFKKRDCPTGNEMNPESRLQNSFMNCWGSAIGKVKPIIPDFPVRCNLSITRSIKHVTHQRRRVTPFHVTDFDRTDYLRTTLKLFSPLKWGIQTRIWRFRLIPTTKPPRPLPTTTTYGSESTNSTSRSCCSNHFPWFARGVPRLSCLFRVVF